MILYGASPAGEWLVQVRRGGAMHGKARELKRERVVERPLVRAEAE